jgi:hypothetical protein
MMTGMIDVAKMHVGKRYAAQKSMCFSINVDGMENKEAILTILYIISISMNCSTDLWVYSPIVSIEHILDSQLSIDDHELSFFVPLYSWSFIGYLIRFNI